MSDKKVLFNLPMSFPSITPFAVIALGVVAVFLLISYLLAFPHPIPGIPYDKASAKRLLGDLPDMFQHMKETGQLADWWGKQCVRLNSPIVQIFSRPFGKPFVILTDFRESQDIVMWRSQEFDQSTFFVDVFSGTLPDHHNPLATGEEFKAHRRLIDGTMTPAFLNQVSIARTQWIALVPVLNQSLLGSCPSHL